MSLTSLLERVQAAEGADPLLDAAVELSLDPAQFRSDEEAKPYTASLDCALALVERVLPGAEYVLDYGCGISACRLPLSFDNTGNAAQGTRTDANMPLAVLAALLQVLIAQGNTHD